MTSILAGLRRAMFSRTRPAADMDVSDLFFLGHHAELVARSEQAETDLESWSGEEIHLLFAARSALGLEVSDLARLLPDPLDRAGLREVLLQQLGMEADNHGDSVLSQPRHVHKSLLAAACGLAAGKRIFVETGTSTGQSLYKITRLFERLWTVEADPLLHRVARDLFAARGVENVTAVLGDSRDMLAAIPGGDGNNAVFFLDAHYSAGITSQQYGTCPVLEEISLILDRFPRSVIVVDDLRTMNGLNGYPTVRDVVGVFPNSASLQIAFDQLIFMPDADRNQLMRAIGLLA